MHPIFIQYVFLIISVKITDHRRARRRKEETTKITAIVVRQTIFSVFLGKKSEQLACTMQSA